MSQLASIGIIYILINFLHIANLYAEENDSGIYQYKNPLDSKLIEFKIPDEWDVFENEMGLNLVLRPIEHSVPPGDRTEIIDPVISLKILNGKTYLDEISLEKFSKDIENGLKSSFPDSTPIIFKKFILEFENKNKYLMYYAKLKGSKIDRMTMVAITADDSHLFRFLLLDDIFYFDKNKDIFLELLSKLKLPSSYSIRPISEERKMFIGALAICGILFVLYLSKKSKKSSNFMNENHSIISSEVSSESNFGANPDTNISFQISQIPNSINSTPTSFPPEASLNEIGISLKDSSFGNKESYDLSPQSQIGQFQSDSNSQLTDLSFNPENSMIIAAPQNPVPKKPTIPPPPLLKNISIPQIKDTDITKKSNQSSSSNSIMDLSDSNSFNSPHEIEKDENSIISFNDLSSNIAVKLKKPPIPKISLVPNLSEELESQNLNNHTIELIDNNYSNDISLDIEKDTSINLTIVDSDRTELSKPILPPIPIQLPKNPPTIPPLPIIKPIPIQTVGSDISTDELNKNLKSSLLPITFRCRKPRMLRKAS